MSDNEMRAEFESWGRDTYRCGENSFSRDHDGRYYSVVGDRHYHATYSDVSMLWSAWRASWSANDTRPALTDEQVREIVEAVRSWRETDDTDHTLEAAIREAIGRGERE